MARKISSDGAAAASVSKVEKQTKKSKKKEKKSRKRSRDRADSVDVDAAASNNQAVEPSTPLPRPTEDKPMDDATAKEQRKSARKAAKLQLLSQIPTHDPDGIPYNKIQLRRMKRRVKHGLDPIPTKEEEREIREREKRERAEEEALYAEQQNDDDSVVDVGKDGENEDMSGEEENQDQVDVSSGIYQEVDTKEEAHKKQPPSKKAKRNKPVPPDYICQACHNQLPDFTTPHWIYDCPMKKTQRGCNKISKKLRGLHDPPSRKVFVSGLPFDCDEGEVKRFFETSILEGADGGSSGEKNTVELVHCKLLQFEDSKRCKGQAFLTFDSDEGAKLALKLNGSTWKEMQGEDQGGTKSGKKKKKGDDGNTSGEERKKLKLRVSKVLNRFVTKRKQVAGKS